MIDTVNNDTKKALAQFVEKIERLENEKQTILIDIKEIYSEAKSHGFDTKVLRQLIRLRKQDEDKLREQEEILDLYKHAIGMV